MMASNGGEVTAYDDVWNLYPILDTSDRKRLSRSCNDILRETRVMRDWPGWPEKAVPIADNGTGDKLLFLREGRLYQPAVYVWLHDTGDLVEVAQSFSELSASNWVSGVNKETTAIGPWQHAAWLRVSGLVAIGFPSDFHLFTLTWNGRGLFDLRTSERTARDYADPAGADWVAPDQLSALGIGEFVGRMISIVGL